MKPLQGVGIVVTRARSQVSPFAALLRSRGASVLVCPTIKIVPPSSWKPLDRAVQELDAYDWLVFTSVNGVEKFFERRRRFKRRPFPRGLKTIAIGPATAEALRKGGIPVTKVSSEYVAESVLSALKHVKGKRILIPRAAVAREVLPQGLKKRGAKVDLVEAYRTKPDFSALPKLKAWLKQGKADCVTFTSSSTVSNFFKLTGRKKLDGNVLAASIGPVTTGTLKAHGWKPGIVAKKPTTAHLAQAIERFYRRRRRDA